MAFVHATVLSRETAALLAPEPGRLVLDGTLGGGGHALALLERGADVIGLDQDPLALAAAKERLASFGARVTYVHGNFRDARAHLDRLGVKEVQGALVDLGVSSPQLDEAGRGFSFSRPGPLDMRMDPTSGAPLSEKLLGVTADSLASIIFEFGEERYGRPIARSIVHARDRGALGDTAALADAVAQAVPRKAWPKATNVATRTFQALRIWVNDELGALAAWLTDLPRVVAPLGRAAAISFHSLEDRLVKQRFKLLGQGCLCPPDLPVCACGRVAGWDVLTKRPVIASDEETARNPRARSAHLRAVERRA